MTTMTMPFATRNDLPSSTRGTMVELLNARLADAVDLQLQAKQAHWNVKGPAFIALHQLFDELHDQAGEWVDLIAERAVQLGGVAQGTLTTVAARSELPRYPTDIVSGRDHVLAMTASLAAFATRMRAAISAAEHADDAGTADLFTEVSRGVDKMLWFIEAHVQTEA